MNKYSSKFLEKESSLNRTYTYFITNHDFLHPIYLTRAASNAIQKGKSSVYFSSSPFAAQSKNASSSVPSLAVMPKNSWIALRRASAWGSVPLYFARALTYASHAGVVPSYTAQAFEYSGELYPNSVPMRSAMLRSAMRDDDAWLIGIEEPSGTSSAPSSCLQSSTSAVCSCLAADDMVDGES
jgi:hypothetical protein